MSVLLWLLAAAGCSNGSPSAPTGGVTLQVGPGPDTGVGNAASCPEIPVPITITTAPAVEPDYLLGVSDASAGSIASQISCDVRAEDTTTFEVDATIDLGRTVGFSITGQLNTGQMDLMTSSADATFVRNGVTYVSQGGCGVDFTSDDNMGAAPGRVWAIVTCPQVSDGQGHTCFASAEFVFEGCGD